MPLTDDSNFVTHPDSNESCCGMWFFYSFFSIFFSAINYYSTFYLTQKIGPLCIVYRSPGLLSFSLMYLLGHCVVGFGKKDGGNDDD